MESKTKRTVEECVADMLGYAGSVRRRYVAEVDPSPVCGLLAMASELDRRDRLAAKGGGR